MYSCISQKDVIGVITKPEEFLLPPDFIYDSNFQKELIKLDYLSYPYPSDQYYLWFTLLSTVINHRKGFSYSSLYDNEKIKLVKDFCDDVKGLFSYRGYSSGPPRSERTDVIPSFLFLEGMSEIPKNFIAESLIKELGIKYNYYVNSSVLVKDKFYVVLDIHKRYIQ